MKMENEKLRKWLGKELARLAKKEQAELDSWLSHKEGPRKFMDGGANWSFAFGQRTALEAVQRRLRE